MEKAPPTKQPRYDAAFRAEALRLASESRSTLAAARALNIDAKRLYAWQKAAQPPLPTDPAETAEVRALRMANKRLAQELDILKKAIAILLHFIDQQRIRYAVQQLCQVLDVVPSCYYTWRHTQAAGAMGTSEPERLAVFDHHERRYGTRRLQVELRGKGHRVGRQALRTGLRRHGRRALQPKAFAPRTTDSTHGQRCAPNLLLDQPRPTQANRVWVSGPHVFAPGQWPLGVPVRLSGRVHQARRRRPRCRKN